MAKGNTKKSFLDYFKLSDSSDDDFDDDLFDEDEDDYEDEDDMDDRLDDEYDDEDDYDDDFYDDDYDDIIQIRIVKKERFGDRFLLDTFEYSDVEDKVQYLVDWLNYTFENFELQTTALFAGLILLSIPSLKKQELPKSKINIWCFNKT